MDYSEQHIKMCERMPRELWDDMDNHYGSYIAWRYFIGIVVPDPNQTKWEGLAALIPETLVLRTWLKEGEETLIVLQTGINYGGIEGDKGTPLYRQDQLWEMIPLKSKFHRITDKLYDFMEWVKVDAPYVTSECSMNQLLEAFVMKVNYNKVWDGEEWA